MKTLIDMRQANGELYPQAVFDAVLEKLDSDWRFARMNMNNKMLDILVVNGAGSYAIQCNDPLILELNSPVVTPAQVIGREKLDSIMIGRSPIHQPSVSYPDTAPEANDDVAAAVRAFADVTGDSVLNTSERGNLFLSLLDMVKKHRV